MWLGAALMMAFAFFLPGLFFFGLAINIVLDLWPYLLFWVGLGLVAWINSKNKARKRRRVAKRLAKRGYAL